MRKKQLRNQMLAVRKTFDLSLLESEMCQKLLSWSVFKDAKAVLSYVSMRGEVDLSRLIALNTDKTWYLPRVISTEEMIFIEINPENYRQTLVLSSMGVLEPPLMTDVSHVFNANSPALLLVPGLTFDRQGFRLGYGKGYYDRYLKQLKSSCPDSITVGVVPDSLLQEKIPADSWDFPVDYLLTEQQIIHIAK